MTHPRFFGYGSLVNTKTHSYGRTEPAQLAGWRREWVGTTLRGFSFLSIRPDPACTLWGLTAEVPNHDWDALDAREFAYARHQAGPLTTYIVEPQHIAAKPHPILLSYIDVVIQGYAHVFGPDGAAHFIATTDGWDRPILNDRAAPLYPRAQTLTPDETALVNHLLNEKGQPLG